MPSQKSVRVALWSLLLLPVLALFAILTPLISGLPFSDDYRATLTFLINFHHAPTAGARLYTILHQSYYEYHLIFQNTVYALQYLLIGHLDLRSLSVVGNLFILPIGLFLCLMLKQFPNRLHGDALLAACLPITWIIYELQFASNLDTPLASLQNLTTLSFILGALYFANQKSNRGLVLAWVLSALAISANGNGVFATVFIALVFLLNRDLRRFAIYVAAISCVIVPYEMLSWNAQAGVGKPSLVWAAVFVGAIGTRTAIAPAILLTFILLAIFAWGLANKLYDRQPAVFAGMLFFFVQAILVSAIRAQEGMPGALGSRYRVNGAIMIALAYMTVLDILRRRHLSPRIIRPLIGAMAVGIVAFTIVSDYAGYKLLAQRRILIQTSMEAWENGNNRPKLSIGDQEFLKRNLQKGVYNVNGPILAEALETGVYILPPPGPHR